MNIKEGAELLATVTNDYACKEIWQRDDIRFLTTDDIAIQSAIYLDRPTHLPLNFSQHFLIGIFFLEKVESALILGLGGGGIPRYLNHFGVTGTAVDIDPQIPAIAKEWFQAPNEDSWTYEVADAQDFLKRNVQKFDYVMFDICLGSHSPDWLNDVETLEMLKTACNDGGVVVLNYLLTDATKFYLLYQNVRQVFEHQVAFMSIEGYINIVIIAFPKEYSQERISLQESKMDLLIAKWSLDFEQMLTKMKNDTPDGSGIFKD